MKIATPVKLPTAAEARERMKENFSPSQTQKELDSLAVKINEAIKNDAGFLITGLININPIRDELKKLGYTLQYSGCHKCWIIHWT